MADPTHPDAIEGLLAHAEWLRALARRLVASDDLASDVEQETWLAAIERPPRDASAPRKWLAQVLRNVVMQHRRSENARRAREANVARPEAVAGADEAVDRAQALRALIESVLALDEPYRSTLLLHYQDGLSIEQIASRQAAPASTVRNRIHRGVAQLRERLEGRHGRAWSAFLLPLTLPAVPIPAAAAAGGEVLAASVAAFMTMATLKLVSGVAVVLLVGAALWWTRSESTLVLPSAASAEAETIPRPLAPIPAATPERAAVGAPAQVDSPQEPATVRRRGSLVVRVTWRSDGSPASDVVVRIHPWGESSPFGFATSQATDSQGLARFTDVASGSVNVEIDRAEGEQAQVRGGEETEVALQIPRGVLVRGQVVDSAGSAVAFAHIWLSSYGNSSTGDEVMRTDGGGRFVLRDVGEARQIAAYAPGHAPSYGQRVLGEPGDVVELILRLRAGAGEIRGTVRGRDGAPVSGAALFIQGVGGRTAEDEDGTYPSSPPPRRPTTDAQGNFVVQGIAPGRTEVKCRARDFAPFSRSFEVAADGSTPITIEMQPGAAIVGVVSGSDGKPASKVFLGIGGYGDFTSSSTSTAADGSFRLEDLAPGLAEIRIRGDAQGQADAALVLEAGVTSRLDVRLQKQGIVAGRVVDEQGAPLPGWRVGAITADHPGLHYRTSITAADGAFQLDNWPKEANALEVREKDRWTGPPAVLVPKIEVGRTDLVLTVASTSQATASIVGRLRGPQGEVVADATLGCGMRGAAMSSGVSTNLSATTGEFRIGPMPPGVYGLFVDSASMGRLHVPERELRAGETLDLGELRFAAPGRVRVQLVGKKEWLETLDQRNVYVQVLGPQRAYFGQCKLDDSLAGLSPPLGAGAYTIEVHGPGLRASPASVSVMAGEEHRVEIALEPAASRSLRLSWGPAGPPKEPIDIVVTDAEGNVVLESEQLAHVREGETWVGLELVVGTYAVEVKTTDGRSARASFAVDDLSPSDVPIDLSVR